VNNTASAANPNTSPFGGFNPFDGPALQPGFTDYILKKGENVADKINRNMFVQLHTDKTSCYIGEPVIATYKLYTRLKSESSVTKNPSFNGFSVVDLQQQDNASYTREKLNGRDYNVYVLRKVQLYPLQSGVLALEPIEVENNVHFVKEAYASRQQDMLSDLMQNFADAAIPAEGIQDEKIILQNKSVTINVKPLPTINTPAAFKGAVGNFKIEAVLEKKDFTTDDAGKLSILISGVGNMQLVTAPDVQWPQGIEAFEPEAVDDIVKSTVPVSGRKLLTYSFTVDTPGTYTLSPIRFSFFSPALGRYQTDSSKPLTFTVTKGTGKKAAPFIAPKKEGKSYLNNFFANRRLVVSTVAILIICGLLFWLKRDKRKEQQQQILEAKANEAVVAEEAAAVPAIPVNWLEKATQLMHNNDSSSFYQELDKALKAYLAHTLQLPVETITKKNITSQLNKLQIPEENINDLQQLMQHIEAQLYTPFPATDKMELLFNNTKETINLLDTYKSN
jgi:hypothetical protein